MKKHLKAAAGFTLVELIVVIAILGILAGVAVPTYSGYVKKANMASDESLINDIKTTLIMSSYGHDYAGDALVKLSVNAAADVIPENAADREVMIQAMENAFGANWREICKLKGEWTGADTVGGVVSAYRDTSLSGKETSLMQTMGHLTGAMVDFFGSREDISTLPKEMQDAMTSAGANGTGASKANAAILALTTSLNTEEGKDAQEVADGILKNALSNPSEALAKKDDNGNYINDLGEVVADPALAARDMTRLTQDLVTAYEGAYEEDPTSRMATLAATATLYAYAQSYAQFAANPKEGSEREAYSGLLATLNIDFSESGNSGAVMNQVLNAFGTIMNDQSDGAKAAWKEWTNEGTWESSQAFKDVGAFSTVMDGLNAASGTLKDNINNETFYQDGTAANLIDAYLSMGDVAGTNLQAGDVAVMINGNHVAVSSIDILN